MFTPNTMIKCEKDVQFIPGDCFNETNNLRAPNVHLKYYSQTVPNSKIFPAMENVNNKGGQCEYYIKNNNSMNTSSEHSSNYEKYKFGKPMDSYYGKINSNLTVNHDMMNIGTLEEIQYPMDESINYEFDIPISLSTKDKNFGILHGIDEGNKYDIGKCFIFFSNVWNCFIFREVSNIYSKNRTVVH